MSGPREWADGPGEPVSQYGGRYDHEPADHEYYHDGPFDHEGDHAYYEDGYYDEAPPGAGYASAGYPDDDGDWPIVPDDRPPSGRRRVPPHDGGGRSGHPVLKVLAVVIVLALVVVGGGLLWAQKQISPGGHRGRTVTVLIPKGASTSRIADLLASAGVIHSGTLFALYVRLHGDTLLAGTYSLPKNSPYSAAIKTLQSGPPIVADSLLIPEGYTVAQIAKAVGDLPHMGLSAQKFLAAADGGSVRSPFEPAGVNNLEGLLFPATYRVVQGESETQILEHMIGAFDDRAAAMGLTSAAAKLGLSPYQVVTVASIVEREARLAGDRADVAGTIYNRLKIGMKLGADSTQAYYLRLTDPSVVPTAAQDDQPSPYNTRLNAGLPPTPIANPGLASLQAAADPPTTTYLYWVEINPDGRLGFASDNAGFVQLQQQCRAAGLC